MPQNDTRPASRLKPYARLKAAKRARARSEEVACQRVVRALNRGLPATAVNQLARHYAEAQTRQIGPA